MALCVYDLQTPGFTHCASMFCLWPGTYIEIARAASGIDKYPPSKRLPQSKQLYEALPAFLASLRRQAVIRRVHLVVISTILGALAALVAAAAGRFSRIL